MNILPHMIIGLRIISKVPMKRTIMILVTTLLLSACNSVTWESEDLVTQDSSLSGSISIPGYFCDLTYITGETVTEIDEGRLVIKKMTDTTVELIFEGGLDSKRHFMLNTKILLQGLPGDVVFNDMVETIVKLDDEIIYSGMASIKGELKNHSYAGTLKSDFNPVDKNIEGSISVAYDNDYKCLIICQNIKGSELHY